MSVKQVSQNAEVDERLAALTTNANAIRVIASAVEGTLGPKGLDTMLVDKFGGVVITNDGVTILNLMEVNHPAAKMLINIAKSQQEEIGDGTTTATIMAGNLVNSGLEQVMKGVPVTRVIEGMRVATKLALDYFKDNAKDIEDLNSSYLKEVALIAGRGYEEIANAILEAAKLIGFDKLKDANFKLADTITAQVGASSEVLEGIIINKDRMSSQMPLQVENPKLLIIDDALEPEEIEEEALATEAGFKKYIELQNEFAENLLKVVKLGVNIVLTDRGISPIAEEIFSDHGIIAIQRVSNKELKKALEHCGGRYLKRTGLKKEAVELDRYCGFAAYAYIDEKLEQLRIKGGKGKAMATVLVSASTDEVVGEMERIAKDAASSVQAAVKGGVIPGGGSIELAASQYIENNRQEAKGMASYGVDCVIEALRKPFAQIVANAGFNSLEKLGDVIAIQNEKNNNAIAVDCDNGSIKDMYELGVIDPALVKIHALKAAGEVAEAILRIDTIIRMKEFNLKDNQINDFDNLGR